jgi:lipopolysaccharide/colanic/teichoic acid biosynthesis glycosyltransferase
MRAKATILLILLEVSILLVSFLVAVTLQAHAFVNSLEVFDAGLTFFVIVWLLLAWFTQKLDSKRFTSLRKQFFSILIINAIPGGVFTIIIYGFSAPLYWSTIVLTTLFFATTLEWLLAGFYFSLKQTKTLREGYTPNLAPSVLKAPSIPVREKEPIFVEREKIIPQKEKPPTPSEDNLEQALLDEVGSEVFQYIASHIDLKNGNHIILSTTNQFNIDRLPGLHYTHLVNINKINHIRYINKFFEAVNTKIPCNGIFIGCAQTQEQRKERFLKKFPPGLNYVLYSLDFIVKRIFPKLYLTRKIYFALTRGKNRIVSRAEILGRLYCCGFEVINEKFLDGQMFFVARKKKEPAYDMHPTYGPFIKLGRTGKNGKVIKVYKIRTMHPYSEYLQAYVYNHHYLREGGKFNNDFRVSTIGRYLRKFWIDETLMILNLLKGEMKLVGVRPLSLHYFSLYSEELQKKRIQFKPGLIPPFYADLPKTLEEIMESEMRYLLQYEKQPIRTDIKYFFLAFYNIVFRNFRSH